MSPRPARATGNRTLARAKAAKQDEFYTRLEDIANELRHYKDHFKGKVVLCNCDDPSESKFFEYFANNFIVLGLKKLIATSYDGSPIAGTRTLFPEYEEGNGKRERPKAIAVVIDHVEDEDGDGATGITDVRLYLERHPEARIPLAGGGDFRSQECIEYLQQADIVVTNPPFSLFREYVAQLVEHGKQFLIIGSKNAITYKEVFKLIKENKLWLGVGFNAGNAYFEIPKENVRDFASGVYDEKTGLVKFRNVGWFTNMDHPKRHEDIPLFKKYSPEAYPTYANYDAIEVGKVADIPEDYDGAMGVPITFLDKYNPDQFKILGSSMTLGTRMSEIAPKGTFLQGGPRFYLAKGDGTYKRQYDRIVIKRRP